METKNDPISAVTKPATAKPSTNDAANINRSALITKRNNPSVRIVTGSVKITNNGFTKILSNPSTNATTTAV
jgi:hypothetical protein